MPLTITEALAEIKTIGKRIEKTESSMLGFLAHQFGIKDPLEAQGGSTQVVSSMMQSIIDLEQRIVTLRRGIAQANEKTLVTVASQTMSIADWLTWRREVAPKAQARLAKIAGSIRSVREQARRQGTAVVAPGAAAQQPSDVIINLDERQLANAIEHLEEVLGSLDGQLSLKNATTFIEA